MRSLNIGGARLSALFSRLNREELRIRMVAVLSSLSGQMLPLALGLWSIPKLMEQAGVERVGFLTISWTLIGYFSLFDFGVSRALIKRLIEVDFLNDTEAGRRVISTGASVLAVTCGLALIIGIMGWVYWPTRLWDGAGLAGEIQAAVPWVIMSVPLAILSTAQIAVLEAAAFFRAAAMVRMLIGAVTFVGPLIAVELGYGLDGMIVAIFVGRIGSFGVALAFCTQCCSLSIQAAAVCKSEAKRLLGFGGWLTLSNVIGPLMLYSDRFVLASMVALATVPFYTIPFEAFTKVLTIPSAVLVVAFPAFAAGVRVGGSNLVRTYKQFLLMTGLIVGFVTVVLVCLAEPFLDWWLGAEFANQSVMISRLLLAGVFVNSLALIAQALVQAHGRPDLTAKLHMVELPLYASYLFFLVAKLGIVGAALAWLIRVSLSALVLLYMARNQLRKSNSQ